MKAFRALLLGAATLLWAGPAMAEAGQGVVTSIKPIHSLVAAVMAGVATPHLIVKGGASPHTYSLKPSDAAALERAKAVFWVGPDLERFLEKSIETLAAKAKVVALEGAHGLTRLKIREGGPFEAHDDDHEAHGHKDQQPHGEIDMHLWLDPLNAKAMVREIEEALVAADPANAMKYKANAKALDDELEALTKEIARTLAPVKGRPFVVFHDGYQYFEKRFGLTAAGAITVSPETLPGAKRVSEIRAKVKKLGATCVFAEPQFEPKLVKVVTEGTSAKSGVLDPIGADLADGPELYFALMRTMAKSIKTCLSPSS